MCTIEHVLFNIVRHILIYVNLTLFRDHSKLHDARFNKRSRKILRVQRNRFTSTAIPLPRFLIRPNSPLARGASPLFGRLRHRPE